MEATVLEYLKVVASWPIVTVVLVIIFKKQISRIACLLERGVEAKLGNLQLKIPPIKISEHKDTSGSRSADIDINQNFSDELTPFQINILRTISTKGNYDELKVSNSLIADFNALKQKDYLSWDREEQSDVSTKLINFCTTQDGLIKASQL